MPWIYVITNLKGEELVGKFCEKELQKTSQNEFRFEKLIKRKGHELYIKWKAVIVLSWIDKKDMV